MVQRESAIPSMSWNEYQARLADGKITRIEPPKHR
jgi:hypothetical protein